MKGSRTAALLVCLLAVKINHGYLLVIPFDLDLFIATGLFSGTSFSWFYVNYSVYLTRQYYDDLMVFRGGVIRVFLQL